MKDRINKFSALMKQSFSLAEAQSYSNGYMKTIGTMGSYDQNVNKNIWFKIISKFCLWMVESTYEFQM